MVNILDRLAVLEGSWTMVGTHPAFSAEAHGTSSFEWLVGRSLLVWRFNWDSPGPPSAVSVIGGDDGSAEGVMIYADVRGVRRCYSVALKGEAWRMWRDAPDFSQRMDWDVAGGGNLITVKGELSRDGSTWEPDLKVTYTRAG